VRLGWCACRYIKRTRARTFIKEKKKKTQIKFFFVDVLHDYPVFANRFSTNSVLFHSALQNLLSMGEGVRGLSFPILPGFTRLHSYERVVVPSRDFHTVAYEALGQPKTPRFGCSFVPGDWDATIDEEIFPWQWCQVGPTIIILRRILYYSLPIIQYSPSLLLFFVREDLGVPQQKLGYEETQS
jgi:hypothetical protein